MRHTLLAVLALLIGFAPTQAAGLLIPKEKNLPPLAMLNHKVTIAIDDQLAVTTVEQTFKNHTDRNLEATYVFPVPKGALTDKFVMWVDGKPTKGEVIEAKKARDIYTSIVRQTQDPGLLEYIDRDLLRMRVFPVPAKGEQKVSFRFTCVAAKEGKLIEYLYPLKTDGKAVQTLDKFSVSATVKSQHGVLSIYSPSHAITMKRVSDREVTVSFDKSEGMLDRDFQMFYSTGKDDIGLTALAHRPVADDKGFFTLLISPRLSLGEKHRIPQDIVFVMDTSGSMRGKKMEQARNALKYCLGQVNKDDRIGLIGFATGVTPYEDKLVTASADQVKKAKKWVDELDANGGTAIKAGLDAALDMRPKNTERPFTVIFFTEGQPTIGATQDDTNPEKIYRHVSTRNKENTRIFTFGVGDDVNAALLDKLAENSRALSTYVRPAEDIEHKVSGMYSKMSNPILTNLKLTTTSDVKLHDVHPHELPDLFHGGQLVVMGRYSGKGASAIKLTGKVGKETKEFVYEFTFPDKTDDNREFVELLWARRKVGALLDQIRISGEKKELVDEIIVLAKKYGITTPYTSYLIVPDGPVATTTRPGVPGPQPVPMALAPGAGGGTGAKPVLDFARKDDRATLRGKMADKELAENAKKEGKATGSGKSKGGDAKTYSKALEQKNAYDEARRLLGKRDNEAVQKGKVGVNYAVDTNYRRYQSRLERVASRNVNGRQCLEVGGVWIDEAFTTKTTAVVVKAQSDAYFALLKAHPELKKVFALGNYVVWVAPSGKALVIDLNNGKEKLTEAEIKGLFAKK